MSVMEDVKRDIMSLSVGTLTGNNETEKSFNLAKYLKEKGYDAAFLGKAKAIKLGLNIFGWSPEFDDIIIKTEGETIFVEVKWVRKSYGYYFLHALSQAVIYKHYFRNSNNGKSEILLCIICDSQKITLNAEEKIIVTHFAFPEDNILIVGE